ncbi:O-antigen ligase family protein [Sulfuricaulis limicola]|uniref:O-antigen ligase family protein n=1 Tax=Sulfuricaulis limicola TaxID=1620215 RepID=UPI0015550CDE|nr:O-antigen ligase family protein [Sulfuricaulis limicola]
MKDKIPDVVFKSAPVAFFFCSLVLLLFIHELRLVYLAMALVMLLLWTAMIVMQGYAGGIRIPRSPLTLSLTLLWIWLAVSVCWSRVPWISTVYFWWIGILPLVFWTSVLSRDHERIWRHVSKIIMFIGFSLAMTAIYQFFFAGTEPKSVFVTRNTHAAILNLIAIPAAGYFLLAAARNKHISGFTLAFAGFLFCLFFSVFLTASRGATLSLIACMTLLLLVSRKHSPKNSLLMLSCVLAGALLLANIVSQGEGIARIGLTPGNNTRAIIWTRAWDMLMESPWLGIGLGNFRFVWPPYRHPLDSSAGFFVHNDYLQIWIEAGLPALLLLVTVLASVLWMLITKLRSASLGPKARIELIALFGGLLAIALHTFVDFNFYIPSILLIAGAILARFHHLAARQNPAGYLNFQPAKFVGKRFYVSIILMVMLIPLSYFVRLSAGDLLSEKALEHSTRGELQEANEAFGLAARFTPSDDRIFVARANLFRHGLTQLPASDLRARTAVYKDALRFLDQAEQLNPLRWNISVVRGLIYQNNPELAGNGWRDLAYQEYSHALKLNPKLYKTRVEYAKMLMAEKKTAAAVQVLEGGIPYYYDDNPELPGYYAQLSKIYRDMGRNDEANQYFLKLIELEIRLKSGKSPVGTYGQ